MQNNEKIVVNQGISQEKKTWPWLKIIISFIFLLLLADVLFLNYHLFFGPQKKEIFRSKKEAPTDSLGLKSQNGFLPTPVSDVNPAFEATKEADLSLETSSPPINVCPEACLQAISEASLSKETTQPAAKVVYTGAKELYIPLGSGSTQSKTYEELMGIEAVVDMANYPKVKSMIFEATIRIPTANGKVYAKLYNVSDKHDVWFSEVSTEGSTGYRAESAEINLASGRKLYRVKLKSTMGYEAILDSARIKIILE